MAAFTAVAVTATVAIAASRTGWFRARHTSAPTCSEIFAWPGVEDAARNAFATLWDQRKVHRVELEDYVASHTDADFIVFGPDRPDAGSRRSRSLKINLFREDLRYLTRHLIFRADDVSYFVELQGADYGPQSDADAIAALRTDLERNTRCVAEALASHSDAGVSQNHTCGRTARDM